MRKPVIDVDGRQIAVSKPDKELYPGEGIDKAKVTDYFHRVAEAMLPHLRDRPLTLRRFPDGIGKDGFFQKQASDYFPGWIRIEDVPQRGGGSVSHVVCTDEATLLYLANQACLEFHVFLSTIDDLDRPDRLVIDLDPADGIDITQLRDTARELRDLFTEVGLRPYLLATGGRGYHAVAPLDRSADFDRVRGLARDIADHLVSQHPDLLTTEQRKDRRGKRIFLDTNRNGYAQTVICPYSLRARPGAPAATPLDWTELGDTAPDRYRLDSLPKRLSQKTDPWSGFSSNAQPAETARRRLNEIRRSG